MGERMKQTTYIVQWLGWGWNTYRFQCGSGDEITFTSLKAAKKWRTQRNRETIGVTRIIRRITQETEVE